MGGIRWRGSISGSHIEVYERQTGGFKPLLIDPKRTPFRIRHLCLITQNHFYTFTDFVITDVDNISSPSVDR